MYWIARLKGGPQRVNHSAVAVEDNIYSFGGYWGGGDYNVRRPIDVHVFNTISLRWKLLTYPANENVPFNRYGHTTVVYQGIIYLWGGRNDVGADNLLYSFDPETKLWSIIKTTGDIPGSRDGHAACVINSKSGDSMYIFGGFDYVFHRYLSNVYAFDFRTENWALINTKGDVPYCTDFHTATAIDKRLYIFGGRGNSGNGTSFYSDHQDFYYNSVFYLDINTSSWHKPDTKGTHPVGRRSHSAFYYGGFIYIFGGYNGITKMHYNDLHKFDPITNTWSLVQTQGVSPSKRRRHMSIVVDNKMYLFGGTSPAFGDGHLDGDYWNEEEDKLLDHDDLNILNFNPSLKVLCILAILKNKQILSNINKGEYPNELLSEINIMANLQ